MGTLAVALLPPPAPAQSRPAPATLPVTSREASPWEILTEQERRMVDRSVARALAWIAMQQRPDGSFPTLDIGQPAVTSLCVLAFLSAGHLPGEGRYGDVIEKAIEYVIRCEHPDGLIANRYPSAAIRGNDPSQTAMYNHAIAGLMLSEVCGMTTGPPPDRLRDAIRRALAYTRDRQLVPKRNPDDNGGWRYTQPWQSSDSDLSVTSWQLMFLRSARNAGFDVPSAQVDAALAYVRRCYNAKDGSFWYALRGVERIGTRAMVGAGALSLAMGGQHETEEARRAGQWLLAHPFDQYRALVKPLDRFFYGAFYGSQAMFQLGGRYWADFYPVLLHTLAEHQRPDGSWDREVRADNAFGNVYTTALAVLALTPPCQLLPVFQR